MNISPLTRETHTGPISECMTLAQKLDNPKEYINYLIYNIEGTNFNEVYSDSKKIDEYIKSNKKK